jgi:hypothetical protein
MDSETLPDFSFNPSARIEGRFFGFERQPLLIIDDVLRHPEQMVDYAVQRGGFKAPLTGSYYPGLNGDLPRGYGPQLTQALRPLLEKGFGVPRDAELTWEGFFGLTTYAPHELEPLQCVPHFDSSNPYRLAIVHYLCGSPYRGTAFFRHLPSGYESISYNRFEPYKTRVEAELRDAPPPQAYVDAQTRHYQQIDYVEAAFNRVAVYRTTSLHAAIMAGGELSRDPAAGRLTANSFIQVAPPA